MAITIAARPEAAYIGSMDASLSIRVVQFVSSLYPKGRSNYPADVYPKGGGYSEMDEIASPARLLVGDKGAS